jgi:hypothetical protein
VYESQAKHRDSLQALFSKETSSSAGGSQLQQLDQRLAALKSSLVQQRAALDSAQWSARTRVADAVLAVQDDTKDLKALQVVATKLSGAGVNTAASALNQLLSQATAQQGKNQEEVRAAQKVLKATASQAEAIAQVEVQYNTTRLIKAKLMSRQLSAKKSQGVLKSALAAADAYLSDIQPLSQNPCWKAMLFTFSDVTRIRVGLWLNIVLIAISNIGEDKSFADDFVCMGRIFERKLRSRFYWTTSA